MSPNHSEHPERLNAARAPGAEIGKTGDTAATDRGLRAEPTAQAQRLEAVGQLAGGVAHDFNNILASMHLQLGLLEAIPDLPETVKTAIRQLREDANRAATLTRQLLTYGGGQVMQLTTLELGRQAEQLTLSLEPMLGPNIRLRVQRAATVWVQADSGMIDQMITNMVMNARDAIGGGAGTITVEVTRRTVNGADQRARARQGEFACVSIRDSGRGLSDEARAHLFEPFFTTKPMGEGQGLGLATAYAIAEQHHGWIDVESRRNEGTLFTIFLPLAVGPSAEPPPPRENGGGKPGGTILLVEDETAVRKLTRVALQRHGYHVLEAADGPAALELWRQHRDTVDVLLTDMVMPKGMTGWQLAQTIRTERPDVGVILTSGYSIDLKRAGVPPGVDFIPKPFPITKLICQIQAVGQRRRAGSLNGNGGK